MTLITLVAVFRSPLRASSLFYAVMETLIFHNFYKSF